MKRRAIVLSAILLGFALLSFAQAPVPFINLPLVPDAAPPGGPQFTLTVNGTGFVSNSVVNWNGTPLATQFVSQGQLTATVPASNIATASTGWVTVVNPPPGGGTSNTVYFTVIAKIRPPLAFNLASTPATGNGPFSMVLGDFNGDGKLDIATANYWDGTLSILLGDGAGNFASASSPTVGSYLRGLAAGDFNGDGKLDLAVTTDAWPTSTLTILLGDGTGNFTVASSMNVGNDCMSIATGDFNGDGKLDLAIAGQDQTVAILLGDGTGNFTLFSSPPTGYDSFFVVVGDFNGDNNLDLAVANYASSTISILLGDGKGNFTPASAPAVSAGPTSIAIGDFNGDGKLDLAVASSDNAVSILLGDGTGNFTLTSTISAPCPGAIAVGDFNGDGKPDLVVGGGANCGSGASVFLGDGKGNFALAYSQPSIYPAWSVATGDFNNDGMLDVAAVNIDGNSVNVLLQVPAVLAVTLSPTSLTFGTQLYGTSSNSQQVTLTNTGNTTVNISKTATSKNFSQTNNCPSSLAPGALCVFYVTFTPENVGTLTGKLVIYDNALNSPQSVPLTGVGTAVTLLPSNLNFGNQQVGTTSQPQTVTLTNYAPKPVTIDGVTLIGNNPGSFAVQSTTCGAKLPAGESCTASITFTPKSRGSKTATFEVKDNAGASPQTVSLSGNGT
jgi:hypothetical protein